MTAQLGYHFLTTHWLSSSRFNQLSPTLDISTAVVSIKKSGAIMKFSRAGYLLVVGYTTVSVVHTTKSLFSTLLSSPVKDIIPPFSSSPLRIAKETWDPGLSRPLDSGVKSDHHHRVQLSSGELLGSYLADNSNGSSGSFSHDTGLLRSTSVDDVLFSKAFATSMRPSQVVPYFYRATGPFSEDEVTITSIITSDRLDVFARLVERYQGPISVTFHVKNSTQQQVSQILDYLQKIVTASETVVRFADIHLVLDSFDRQFNTWRNIARLFARTNFVMMLDIDFYLCTDFRLTLRNNPWVRAKLEEGLSAFVIPAFEYTDPRQEKGFSTFPTTKQDLLSKIKAGTISMFHASWKPGHNSTDYPKFYNAPAGDVYKVTTYQSAYEPYVIFKKAGPPWCEERFVGYGGNKAACLFEMYLSGMNYYVLADHFIIHQKHLYEESARRTERKYNRKIYASFKEEVCFRYLRSYRDTGRLNTTRARNAISECRKLKPIRMGAPQLLGD
ncbi:hypothetical protein CC1G_01951 [Coprinopsis cinerea okayama7|uniref:Glycosyltransferase family 49 protein n=1 Tax=Coprinopsis cinerea (strain Okayama-7 / 130 / ATCC MYA-4618 / FGSC 9003) TaxID=240176 RepID=A8N628_COPC7|nr:hypothetical protein CC1G_01951 [Coprinopsis cinerea okayama7\|eukprot:XP_001830315.2 hypothetical protein CC1G_01951 [Coprinopsis cinerea okayama7\